MKRRGRDRVENKDNREGVNHVSEVKDGQRKGKGEEESLGCTAS